MNDKEKKSELGEMIKKVVSVGIGAAFMTEESVRKIVEDLPLPKDILQGLITNAKGAKEEFRKSMQTEFSNFLTKMDTKKVVSEVLENFDIEIEAKIKFKKKKNNKNDDDIDDDDK